MEEHPNATKYREVTKAFNAGNVEDMTDYVADDVEWWYIGGDQPARGKQALMEMFGALSDVDIKVDLHDVVANDEHLIALVNATATRGGRTLNYKTAEIHHVKDGKITHRWAFSDDTEAIIKFFA
jgi:ketosteroid isomerase-like protein